jgi:hypothetical protein
MTDRVVGGVDRKSYLVSTMRYKQLVQAELWETAVFEGGGLFTTSRKQRFSMWTFDSQAAQAAHLAVAKRVRTEPPQSWTMHAAFIATVRQSAITAFERPTNSAPATPRNLIEYAMHLMGIADRDTTRLVDCWQVNDLTIDWEKRLMVLREFTLFYIHMTDRYVAGQGFNRRQEVMAAVNSVAWYSYLGRSVAEPLPDDLTSDPAIAENWRGFLEDLQLRHRIYGSYPSERVDDPGNPEGTFIWEFGKLLALLVGRSDDVRAITCVLSAMDGSLADLDPARVLAD